MEVGPGIVLDAPDAQILQLIRFGDDCPPDADNFGDLVTLAALLAEEDFVKAQEVAEQIANTRRPMRIEASSSMVEPNHNHLKRNPFKR